MIRLFTVSFLFLPWYLIYIPFVAHFLRYSYVYIYKIDSLLFIDGFFRSQCRWDDGKTHLIKYFKYLLSNFIREAEHVFFFSTTLPICQDILPNEMSLPVSWCTWTLKIALHFLGFISFHCDELSVLLHCIINPKETGTSFRFLLINEFLISNVKYI